MRVLITNEFGDRNVIEATDVTFDSVHKSLYIICLDQEHGNYGDYTIRSHGDDEVAKALSNSLDTLLEQGYVDLSAYRVEEDVTEGVEDDEDYDEDDSDEVE